jgi:hypothetical protein
MVKMTKGTNSSSEEKSPSRQIDEIINEANNWRGKKLSQLRTVIMKVDTSIVEEVKWKKPSCPEGVPVWSSNGIVCIANILKNAVRLTFPRGATIADPMKLFNSRLDSKTVRAVDFHETDALNVSALIALIKEAIVLNASKISSKGKKIA